MVQQNDGKKKKNQNRSEENAGDETVVTETPMTESEDQEVLEALDAAEEAADEAQAAAEEAMAEAQSTQTDADSQGYTASSETDASEPDESASEKEKVTIEFPFSGLIRERVPKAFEVAEKVATDWKNEGDFADLGITHPVAGIVAAQALIKAKEVEKKLEEKGVISMAKMGFAIAKSQVDQIKNKIVK